MKPIRLFLTSLALVVATVLAPLVVAATAVDTLVGPAATTTVTGTATQNTAGMKLYQVTSAVGTGTGTTTAIVQGSNDAANWETLGTVTVITGTTTLSGSVPSNDSYAWVRANVTTLGGTTPTVTVTRSR